MNQISIHLREIGASTSEAAIRHHRVQIDRPESNGGADAGPMGGELFLASVGGCFMSNLLAANKARGGEVSNIRTEVTGTLSDSPARFTSIAVRVMADGTNPELLERLIEIADRGCIMMNTLRDKIEIRIQAGPAV